MKEMTDRIAQTFDQYDALGSAYQDMVDRGLGAVQMVLTDEGLVAKYIPYDHVVSAPAAGGES